MSRALSLTQALAALDLGPDVAVKISHEARSFAKGLPREALAKSLSAISDWARSAPVRAARVSTYTDCEDEDWTELLVQLLLDVENTDTALKMWEELGRALERVDADLSESDRWKLAGEFGVHLLWGDDDLNDETQPI